MLASWDEIVRKAVEVAFGTDTARSLDRDGATSTTLPGTGGGAFNSTVHRVFGGAEEAAWSVVVKEFDAGASIPAWDREADVYHDAEWLELSLPAGLRSPRLLASNRSASRVILVLEDLTPSPAMAASGRTGRSLTDRDLAAATRLLAQFNVSPAPPRPWWSVDFLSTEFTTLADHPARLKQRRDDPRLEELRQQLLRLHGNAPSQLAFVGTLPQGPAHLDAYSRNLIVAGNGVDGSAGDIGLIDWSNAGSAPLGADQATLFALTLDYLDVDAGSIHHFEEEIIESMLSGLADADSNATTDVTVRAFEAIAELRHLAMMMNALPMVERKDPAVSAIVGCPLDETIDQWLTVGRHFLR